MVNDESGLKSFLDKMRPMCQKETDKMNAKGSRVSVTKSDEGDLFTIEKGSFGHKAVHLLLSGDSFKAWRDKPDKLVFEGNVKTDLRFNYQKPGFGTPYGLGRVAITMNADGDINEGLERLYLSITEDLNENDMTTVAEFKKEHRLKGSLEDNNAEHFNKYFDDRGGAMFYAARDGHLDRVKQLMEYGFELDARDETPLIAACSDYDPDEGQKDVIAFLLENGANPNKQYNEDDPFQLGQTPLIALIDHYWGEDEDQDGALLNTFKILLDNGADVNLPGENGDTPLLVAVHRGWQCVGLVRLFLEYGADRTVTGEDGQTPLEIAQEDEEEDIVALLTNG